MIVIIKLMMFVWLGVLAWVGYVVIRLTLEIIAVIFCYDGNRRPLISERTPAPPRKPYFDGGPIVLFPKAFNPENKVDE